MILDYITLTKTKNEKVQRNEIKKKRKYQNLKFKNKRFHILHPSFLSSSSLFQFLLIPLLIHLHAYGEIPMVIGTPQGWF